MNLDEAARLRALAEQLIGLSGQESAEPVFRHQPAASRPGHARTEEAWNISDHELQLAARRELARRRLRPQFLPAEWFSEAPWNVMLDLFDQELCGRDVSITSACLAASVPTTTALRSITAMVEAGLVDRSPDRSDERRSFLRLSRKGNETIRALLRAMIEAEAGASAQRHDIAGEEGG